MSELPKGWVQTNLGEVAFFNYGKSLAAAKRKSGDIDVYGSNGVVGQHNEAITESPAIIVGRKGSFGEVHFSKAQCFPIDTTYFVDDFSATEARFVFSLLKHLPLKEMNRATAIPGLNREDAHSLPIQLPPLAEQRRIVKKLDTLGARTTTARTHLNAVAKLVERYRQQVLELAFTGGLTKDLRQENEGQSTRDALLPLGWETLTLGEISEIQGGIQVGKKRLSNVDLVEVPYLRVANVQRGWLNLDEIKTISVTPQEKERLLLQDGDILMNEGGDRDKLGRGWIWRGEVEECIHQNHVFRIRLLDTDFPSEFVSHYANEMGQKYFFDEGKQTTNLASISKSKVSSLPVPIPPVSEALDIVRRIHATFAKIDRLAAEADRTLKLTERLDQRILAKAFAGELVPQDPSDEPASELLNRIHETRAKAPKKPQRRPKKKEAIVTKRSLEEVLSEAKDWLPSQEAFRRCGIADGAETEAIEELYAELRALDKAGRLEVEPVADAQGRKLHDRLKIKAA